VRNIRIEDLADERFDVVCAFEVLEHIEDDVAAVKEWSSLLRPGGHLLLSVPAFQRLFSVGDEMMGHFRRYDPDVMKDVLTRGGLADVSLRVYGFPLCYLLDAPRTYLRNRQLSATSRTMEDRTASSGRFLQPASGQHIGAITQAVTAPFRVAQRRFPNRGTCLVARARVAG
jgi:SAM-dependent methyltransferase